MEKLTGAEADKVEKEFKTVIETPKFSTRAKKFDPGLDRLDDFWVGVIQNDKNSYEPLFTVLKTIFVCFHGNADVERGFSINEHCLFDSQKEKSLVALRHVDHVVYEIGGIENKELPSERREGLELHKPIKEKISVREDDQRSRNRQIQQLQAEREEVKAIYIAERQRFDEKIAALQ
ncbi:hypothetical protein QAD02_021696 [Eretmocerus hayati]|uniref:Uncharacterized protein n=1 Tax=Eretmocerus hayati TaxID=131215 RepID=A0ACC2PSD3_9HYME|nr:hypothetical protein QAD02_021696 [Eretmocerus hayati]